MSLSSDKTARKMVSCVLFYEQCYYNYSHNIFIVRYVTYMKDTMIFSIIAPIALSLIGILCNVIGFLGEQPTALNFIFSVIYCIIWGIILYFAPRQNSRPIHIYFLLWWFFSLLFSISMVFANHLHGGEDLNWDIIPCIIFVAPISGIQYPFGASSISKYFIAFLSFIFFVVSLCQYLIFRNMKDISKNE